MRHTYDIGWWQLLLSSWRHHHGGPFRLLFLQPLVLLVADCETRRKGRSEPTTFANGEIFAVLQESHHEKMWSIWHMQEISCYLQEPMHLPWRLKEWMLHRQDAQQILCGRSSRNEGNLYYESRNAHWRSSNQGSVWFLFLLLLIVKSTRHCWRNLVVVVVTALISCVVAIRHHIKTIDTVGEQKATSNNCVVLHVLRSTINWYIFTRWAS